MIRVKNFTSHIVDFRYAITRKTKVGEKVERGTVQVLPSDSSITGRIAPEVFADVEDDVWGVIKKRKLAKKLLRKKMVEVSTIKTVDEKTDEKK